QGNYSEAVKAYDKAIEIKPDFYEAWNNKGFVILDQGNFLEALKAFDKAIEIKPDFHLAWNNKGTTLDKQGNYSEAVKAYDKAIEIKPDFHVVWNNKGNALLNDGNYPEAVKACSKAIEIKPDFYEAWYTKGSALAKQSNYSEAVKAYDKAIEIKEDYYKAWFSKGGALAEQGKFQEAMRALNQANKLNPWDADVLIFRGLAHFRENRIEEGISDIKRSGIIHLQVHNDSVMAFDSFFCVYNHTRQQLDFINDDVIYCILALYLLNLDSETVIPFDTAMEVTTDLMCIIKQNSIINEQLKRIITLTTKLTNIEIPPSMNTEVQGLENEIKDIKDEDKRKELLVLLNLLKKIFYRS
ncbi:MAG: tetratricopeptide repeat protein, partial [Candidatus Odinarchaeota archaeon]